MDLQLCRSKFEMHSKHGEPKFSKEFEILVALQWLWIGLQEFSHHEKPCVDWINLISTPTSLKDKKIVSLI